MVCRFDPMRTMMANLGSGGMLSRIPGMGQLAGAGGLDPSLLDPGGGGLGRTTTAKRRARQKGKRKQARKARKKNRRH